MRRLRFKKCLKIRQIFYHVLDMSGVIHVRLCCVELVFSDLEIYHIK